MQGYALDLVSPEEISLMRGKYVFSDLGHPAPLILTSPGPGLQMLCHEWDDPRVCAQSHARSNGRPTRRADAVAGRPAWKQDAARTLARLNELVPAERLAEEARLGQQELYWCLSALLDFEVFIFLNVSSSSVCSRFIVHAKSLRR